MKIAFKEYETWKLDPKVATALRLCLSKETTRYSFAFVGVSPDSLATTTGNQLLIVKGKHEIPAGAWKLTSDDYLLPGPADTNFPNWESVLYKPADKRMIREVVSPNSQDIAGIVWAINHEADVAVRLDVLLPMLQALSGLSTRLTVWVARTDSGSRPVQIEAAAGQVEFIYIQMPVMK